MRVFTVALGAQLLAADAIIDYARRRGGRGSAGRRLSEGVKMTGIAGFLVAALTLALAACTNPYDPAQNAIGGGLLGAGLGAAIGAAAGGGPGAALGAAIGGATGVVGGAASTPPPPGYYGYNGYPPYGPSVYGYPPYGPPAYGPPPYPPPAYGYPPY